jgi:hypothetical protein
MLDRRGNDTSCDGLGWTRFGVQPTMSPRKTGAIRGPGLTSIVDVAARHAELWVVFKRAQFGFDTPVIELYMGTGTVRRDVQIAARSGKRAEGGWTLSAEAKFRASGVHRIAIDHLKFWLSSLVSHRGCHAGTPKKFETTVR